MSFSSTLAIVCGQRFIVISVSLRRSWHLSHPLMAERTAARSCGPGLELRRSSARIRQEHHGDQRQQYETSECSSSRYMPLSVATAWTWHRNRSGPMHIGQKIGAVATALLNSSTTSNSTTSSSPFVWVELSLIWILVLFPVARSKAVHPVLHRVSLCRSALSKHASRGSRSNLTLSQA